MKKFLGMSYCAKLPAIAGGICIVASASIAGCFTPQQTAVVSASQGEVQEAPRTYYQGASSNSTSVAPAAGGSTVPVNLSALFMLVEYRADGALTPAVSWKRIAVNPGLVQIAGWSSNGKGGPVLSPAPSAGNVEPYVDPAGKGLETTLGEQVSPQLAAAALRAFSKNGLQVFPPLIGSEAAVAEGDSLTWVERIVGSKGFGGKFAPLARQANIDGVIVVERLAIERAPVAVSIIWDKTASTGIVVVPSTTNPQAKPCAQLIVEVPRIRLRASAISTADGRLVAQIDETKSLSALPDADRKAFAEASILSADLSVGGEDECTAIQPLLSEARAVLESELMKKAVEMAEVMMTEFTNPLVGK